MNHAREVKIGKLTFIIQNVPDNLTDDEVKQFAIKWLTIETIRRNVIKEVYKNDKNFRNA